jgi:hypothetical protein
MGASMKSTNRRSKWIVGCAALIVLMLVVIVGAVYGYIQFVRYKRDLTAQLSCFQFRHELNLSDDRIDADCAEWLTAVKRDFPAQFEECVTSVEAEITPDNAFRLGFCFEDKRIDPNSLLGE